MSVLRTSARILVAGFVAAGFAACGGGGDADPQTGGATGTQPAAAVENPARITGTINFAGSPPPNEPIDMSQEASCAAKHTDQPTKRTVVVNDGRLQNVFVYVKEGISGSHPAPSQPIEVDQDGCIYDPHVSGAMVGQTINFKNSDGILHNVKAVPTNQQGFNISQPTNMTTPRTFRATEVMVPIECNVHGWMQAYIGVLDHPYFAVSGEDGTFTIENLPPGTYTIETWHERYGTQTQQVTLGPDATQEITFDYNASMAAGAVVPLGQPIDPHGSHVVARHAGAHAGAR